MAVGRDGLPGLRQAGGRALAIWPAATVITSIGDGGARGPAPSRLPDDILERYIAQQIEAWPDDVVSFSWHGGELTVLGIDYFRRVVEIQSRLCPGAAR